MAPSSIELEQARRLVLAAPRVLVLTGAGIGAESGVPHPHDSAELWQGHRPDELETAAAFEEDPRLVWEWYACRHAQIHACQPSRGHLALASFALRHGKTLIITQNVDGLHTRAARDLAPEVTPEGDPEPAVPVELHGNLFWQRCTSCSERWRQYQAVDFSSRETLPTCPSCGALARPHVVWVGEELDASQLSLAFCEAELAAVCLVVGTGDTLQPAASLAAVTAQAGGEVIEVNPEETPLTPLCSSSLRDDAAAVLPTLLEPPDA